MLTSTLLRQQHTKLLRTALTSTTRATQVRQLNVHEYISMELMNQHQIPTPVGAVATTPEEAEHAYATKFSTGKDAVIKAQVLSGGRGLGTFKNGFQGGVHMVTKSGQVSVCGVCRNPTTL